MYFCHKKYWRAARIGIYETGYLLIASRNGRKISMNSLKNIELEQALNRVGSLFWTQVVGRRPKSYNQQSDEFQCLFAFKVESFIQELNLPPLYTLRQKPSEQELEVLWDNILEKVLLHIDSLTQQVNPRDENLLFMETATLPRLLTATFLNTIGYEDIRRLIFEGRIREDAVPDNDILLFMFLRLYMLLSDLFMRGSRLRGSVPHGMFLGDSVLGELYMGLEYGFLENPTCYATGLLWVLSRIKSGELDGQEDRLLEDLFPLFEMARGSELSQITSGHIWQKIKSFSLKYLPARRMFMSRMSESIVPNRLFTLLENDKEFVWSVVCQFLIRYGPDAIAPLIEMITKTNDDVRGRIVNILSHIGEPVIDPLVKALKNKQTQPWAIATLAKIGKPAVAPLITALKDEQAKVGAIVALGKVGEPAVIPLIEVLVSAGREEDRNAMQSIADALENIGEPSIGYLVELSLDQKQGQIIKEIASDIINQIKMDKRTCSIKSIEKGNVVF